MKKINIEKSVKDSIFAYSVSGIIIACFIIFVMNISVFTSAIKNFLGIISPFIWGLVFAYLSKGIAVFFENHFPDNWSIKVRRILSSVIAILCVILCIFLILIIIIPQLGPSFSSISGYITDFVTHLGDIESYLLYDLKFSRDITNMIMSSLTQITSALYQFGSKYGPAIITSTIAAIGNLFNFALGLIIALFFLIERGKIKENIKFLAKRVLSPKKYATVSKIYYMTISKFYDYFKGSIIDSILVGFECFLLMSIFRIEYSGLVSVIVGITNIIPFFGPFIGGVPSFLLILLANPFHAVIFGIICIAIQQIDGNFIAPKIIGDSVGVPRLWCMFVIIVGGAYFGFFGMILGVPLFSVVYFYVTEYFKGKKISAK